MTNSQFLQEVEEAIRLYEQAIGHAAARTRPMIERLGAVEALSRLMISADLQNGFKALRDSNQLDKTFEAIVTRFPALFTSDTIQAAEWRLANPYSLL